MEKVKNQTVYSTEIVRISSENYLADLNDEVVVEKPLTIMIDKVGSFTVMATPSDIVALAVGFVYSEGLIESIDDIVSISTKPELPDVVGIQVHEPTKIDLRRNMIIASSCGMCGKRNIDKTLKDITPCNKSLVISSELVFHVTQQMNSMQKIFHLTGGSHAAAIFNSSGKIVSFAEDLGRHSALDKAIGKCLSNRIPFKGLAAALSGRISFEMVTKAAKAKLELIAAVSAPSSFALEAANKWNITLCGFVRQNKMNIYTNKERISDIKKSQN